MKKDCSEPQVKWTDRIWQTNFNINCSTTFQQNVFSIFRDKKVWIYEQTQSAYYVFTLYILWRKKSPETYFEDQ
jgi:hypothetical protein